MGCAASTPANGNEVHPSLMKKESDTSPELSQAIARAKLVMLGDTGVGKSSLLLQFARGEFDPQSKVTVGAAFMAKVVKFAEHPPLKFEVWDTAGQERYAALAPLYYRGAAAALVVFDITSKETFSKAKFWVKELQKNGAGNVIMALVGNKLDLREKRGVSVEEANEFASNNRMLFFEASAKSGENVHVIFEAFAKSLHSQVPS